MISGTGSYISAEAVVRQDATILNASTVHKDDTILAQSETVQQTSAVSETPHTKTDNASPIISLSSEVVTTLQNEEGAEQTVDQDSTSETAEAVPSEKRNSNEETSASGLTEAESAQVDSLKERDREVRTHEQAHAVSGGQYAGSPSYEYETGPDGQQYAIGGEVQIDTAPIAGDPAATIAKMETVIRAAMAPADPSGQDRSVAAAASQRKVEAQAELNALKQAERSGEVPDDGEAAPELDPIEPSSTGSFVNPAANGNADKVINIIA